MIEVQELFKYYGASKAAGPLSFSIKKGEIVGLLGLNGAGKTTALRVLACDLLPSSGTVRVDGIDVMDRPEEVRKRVGFLPDTPPLYNEMTVWEYLLFAAQLRGLPKSIARKQTRSVTQATGLSQVEQSPIGSLSHGYRQRVGIAQALVHAPQLVLLDEPSAGLDPVQIVEMRRLLKSLKGGYTVVLSSHILSEISEICDRLLVLRQGQVVASGTEAELSSQLLKGLRLELTVRAAPEVLDKTLKKVPEIRSVQVSPVLLSRDEYSVRLTLERDIREELIRTLVTADIGILEMTRAEHELEQIFLQLASPDPGVDPAPKPHQETIS